MSYPCGIKAVRPPYRAAWSTRFSSSVRISTCIEANPTAVTGPVSCFWGAVWGSRSGGAGAGISKAGVPPPPPPYGTPYYVVRPPRGPRRALGPPLARGLVWRHWGAITDNGAVVVARCTRALRGSPVIRWPNGRAAIRSRACRCGGLFRQYLSWMETALLGRVQPQTQQTGFASRKSSLLVKELLDRTQSKGHTQQEEHPPSRVVRTC
jgi:hypothetical protein